MSGGLARLVVGIVLLLAIDVAPAVAQSLVGVASVIDGDTIEIHGQRIRLDDLILVDQIVSTCPPVARAAEYEQIPQ